MIGYANHCRNGVESRHVFYNGAYYGVHRVIASEHEYIGRSAPKPWYSVRRVGQRYARCYGERLLAIKQGRY